MIVGVILAAGASSRMGRPKALLPIASGGPTFVAHLAATLEEGGVDDVIVVVGGVHADAVRSALAAARRHDASLRVIENPDPARGQLSSLLVALDAADRPGVEAIVLALVDAPLVGAATVALLLDEYRQRGRPLIVRPERNGVHGHPVIFDRRLFDELRAADPAAGAKTVLRAHVHEIVHVPMESDGPFIDIDTPDDYRRVFGETL